MKPTRSEDVTSILAITCGAAVSVGLTAALLLREPHPRAHAEVEVLHSDVYIHHVPRPVQKLPRPVQKLAGPEGSRMYGFPGPRLHEYDLHEVEVIRGKRLEESRPAVRVRVRRAEPSGR